MPERDQKVQRPVNTAIGGAGLSRFFVADTAHCSQASATQVLPFPEGWQPLRRSGGAAGRTVHSRSGRTGSLHWRMSQDDRVCLAVPRTRPCLGRTKREANPASEAMRYNATSSSFDGGELWASACRRSNLRDSCRESRPEIVQQRPMRPQT